MTVGYETVEGKHPFIEELWGIIIRLSLFSLHFVDFLCENHLKNLQKVQRSDSVQSIRKQSCVASILYFFVDNFSLNVSPAGNVRLN